LKAAERGDAEAQNHIGWVYDVGLGMESDYTEAFKWFVMAAEQGLAIAQANVGEYYEFGKGVPKDLEQAVVWYQKAAELECEAAVEALKRLGR
jgi:Sel1 repeat protein